jgi:predicted nucleic acid-binding protein
MTVFIDTWGFKALLDAKDSHHNTAKEIYSRLWEMKAKLITSDYVLDETYTLLSRAGNARAVRIFSETIASAAEENFLEIAWVGKRFFYEALEMKLKYTDKLAVSFTDFTSMAIMLNRKITHVMTEDKHFGIVNLGFTPFSDLENLPL